jgi:xylulokinase
MYNLRIILDAFRQQGASIPTLRLIGGGARSGLWRQIAADILGVPILRPELLVEATSLGAAIAGGVGVGMWSNYAEAGRLIAVGPGEQPDRPIQSEYDRLFPIFEELYADLVPTFERIALRTSPESRGAKNGG